MRRIPSAKQVFKFDEETDDQEVIKAFFDSVDTSKDGLISREELVVALEQYKDCGAVTQGLTILEENLNESGSDSFDFKTFDQYVKKIPRVRGQRLKWSGSLRLDCMLARHLPVGPLFDELAGIRAMTDSELHAACDCFFIEARSALVHRWSELRAAVGASANVASHRSLAGKFADPGMVAGVFGQVEMFQVMRHESHTAQRYI
jgi:hypothetical protein